jgi:hypothetical protein
LNFSVDWIDLVLVGYILMGAGVLIIILGIVLITRRRKTLSTTRTGIDPGTGEQITRSENSIDNV